MLTLDPTTLFYFSLMDLDGKDKNTSLIKDWAKQIPRNAKPGSTHSKLTPSLTQGSTHSSYAPLWLSLLSTQLKSATLTMALKLLKVAFQTLMRSKAMSKMLRSKVPQRVNKGLWAQSIMRPSQLHLRYVTGPCEGQRLTKAHHPTNQMARKAYKWQAA